MLKIYKVNALIRSKCLTSFYFSYSYKLTNIEIYTLEDLKWDKMRFFKVYPFQENVNFDYVASSNTTDEF